MSRQEQSSFPPVIVYTGRALSRDEEQQLRRYSSSIIVKGARSPERLLDEVTLFLHQVESELPPERQRMLRDVRDREAVFEGRRVLVVEDDVRNIFALSSVLEPKGAKVEIARNGREALAACASKPGVDLVLMDVMMPEMDGLEAMREIRKRPELAQAADHRAHREGDEGRPGACLAAGANDYIAKPLDVDKLLSLCAGLDAQVTGAPQTVVDIELELLLEAIFLKYHYDFRGYAPASLKRRLARRADALRVRDDLARCRSESSTSRRSSPSSCSFSPCR